MKTLVKKTALDLIEEHGVTTTLEVKEQLIATQPTYFWKQNFVSETLAELAEDGELNFTNNGNFRIYELPSAVSVSAPVTGSKYVKVPLSQRSTVKASVTELAKLVEDNAGKFMTVVHTNRTTGAQNVMNCQELKGLTPLGSLS